MNKLNFSAMEDIRFDPAGTGGIVVPIEHVWSWGRMLKANGLLHKTKEYITKWYWDCGGLENVLNGIGPLWDTLKDAVAEMNLQDILDRGCLSVSKDDLKSKYDDYGQPFADGLQYLTDFYLELTADEASKQAYREYRKETRGRVMGVGFGITGGIKAAMSAGLGNMASGMAHGAFNAIANGIGSIAQTGKLNDFYRQEDTLNSLLDGWTAVFWEIYDDHQIDIINRNFVENGSPQVYTRVQLLGGMNSAKTRYQNLKKARETRKVSQEVFLEAIVECIGDFPFETQYWKDYFTFSALNKQVNTDFFDQFVLSLRKIGEYDLEFDDGLVNELTGLLVSIFMHNEVEELKDINEPIFDLLKEKLANDENFEAGFDNAVENKIKYKEAKAEEVTAFFELIKRLDYDIARHEHDEEFTECYNDKKDQVVLYKINKNRESIINAIQKNDVDSIARFIMDDSLIIPETALSCIFSIFKNNMDTIPITGVMLQTFENLRAAVNVVRALNTFDTFKTLKDKAAELERIAMRKNLPLEAKIEEFRQYMKVFVEKYGAQSPGKTAYWDNIPAKIISNVKNNFEFTDNDEHILAVFDTSPFNSGKSGIAVTTKGIHYRDDYGWFIAWTGMVENYTISLTIKEWKGGNKLVFKKKETEEQEVIYSSDRVYINFEILAAIIRQSCLIFTGIILPIENLGDNFNIDFELTGQEPPKAEVPAIQPEPLVTGGSENTIPAQEPALNTQAADSAVPQKSEDYYNFLREDDRIYRAVKFKERKGFFKHILPASWILTFGFYGLLAFMLLVIAALTIPSDNGTARMILGLLFMFAVPVGLLVFGIRNRLKYWKEKKNWKSCTDNGKKDIQDVFKEYQKLENEYIGI